jgi:hypothetical protein
MNQCRSLRPDKHCASIEEQIVWTLKLCAISYTGKSMARAFIHTALFQLHLDHFSNHSTISPVQTYMNLHLHLWEPGLALAIKLTYSPQIKACVWNSFYFWALLIKQWNLPLESPVQAISHYQIIYWNWIQALWQSSDGHQPPNAAKICHSEHVGSVELMAMDGLALGIHEVPASNPFGYHSY